MFEDCCDLVTQTVDVHNAVRYLILVTCRTLNIYLNLKSIFGFYIDLMKAFDSIREEIWKELKSIGVPNKITVLTNEIYIIYQFENNL